LSDDFLIQNVLKQGDALLPVLFNFALKFAIRKVQKNQMGLKLSGTHQLLVYAADVNLLGDNIDIIKINSETLIYALLPQNVTIKTHKTLILPGVLYGCETWSLTLRNID
jgi:hypothetical protein